MAYSPHSHSPHPFTDYLIAQTGDLWRKYVYHPFVVQLGKGTLPMKAFLHFIRQDYSFLFHYARTNALAAYKAKTFEDLASSNFIVQTVLHEVQMHIEVGQLSSMNIMDGSTDRGYSIASHKVSQKKCLRIQKKA